ncbi:uncharacterized protein LOC121376265 [Gigantopelta aegis]|uniref:uncharacterized protein LOC121376265 n=1 Tax=Gigantopelta aegis TaxID=1735272 RepID=UPI001B88842F|nr:uncharacterized protein LOC121376265 [Gigantopelta aegis]
MGLPLSRPNGTGSVKFSVYPSKYQSRLFQMRSLLQGQRYNERCYPSIPYKPYPASSAHQISDDGLVLRFRAIPEKLVGCDLPSETYWWVDAQFLPYNDSQMIVTSTAYIPRANFPWLPVNDIPAGRILLYTITLSPIGCENFVRTTTRSYPKVQPHPRGDLVGYIQSGDAHILNLDNETVYSQPKDLMTGPYRFMAIAPNGIHLAMICRGQGFYYLKVAQMDVFFRKVQQVSCHKLCPGFVACRTFTDHVECRWSPDSQYLGVSSSLGRMFVVNASSSFSDVTVVCRDLIEDEISNAGCFAFDPRFDHQVVAVGGRCSYQVHIVDVETQSVLFCIPGESEEDPVDCVEYTSSGSLLAVAFHDLVIRIYSTTDGSEIHTVDMKDSCRDLAARLPSLQFPAVQRLSFSLSGTLLTTSMCDGFVSVWNIPTNFSLRYFCKLKILTMLPVRCIKKLNLPTTVKNFLLS